MSDLIGRTEGIEPIFVSVKDAAKALGISNWRMYELTSDRDGAPAVEVRWEGARKLVSVASLREYAASLPTERPPMETTA